MRFQAELHLAGAPLLATFAHSPHPPRDRVDFRQIDASAIQDRDGADLDLHVPEKGPLALDLLELGAGQAVHDALRVQQQSEDRLRLGVDLEVLLNLDGGHAIAGSCVLGGPCLVARGPHGP